MSNTTFTSFTEILTSLYNGNRGEAQQAAEVIKYDNTFSLSEESQRHKQYRANYEALRLKKYFEDVTIHQRCNKNRLTSHGYYDRLNIKKYI